MDDIYNNIEEYNPNKKQKILSNFDNIIADVLNNKNNNLVVTEAFFTCKKLNIYLVFNTQT